MNFLAQSRFGATKEIVEDNVGRLQRVSFSPHGLAHLCQMVKDFEQRSFSNDLDGIECETRLSPGGDVRVEGFARRNSALKYSDSFVVLISRQPSGPLFRLIVSDPEPSK